MQRVRMRALHGRLLQANAMCQAVVDDGLIEAVNACSFADKGFLPAQGAILDQANWFCDLWLTVGNEQIAIDNERLEKLERRL